MKFKHNIILMDFSRQIGINNLYKYTKTYLYSIRIDEQEAIQLSELEYKICLLLKEKREYQEIQRELLYDLSEIEKTYCRLNELGIVNAFHESDNIRILNPYDEEIEGIRNFPRTIVWNITSKCNLSCRHCIEKVFEDEIKDIIISKNKIHVLLQEMNQYGLERLQVSGGEPFISPLFEHIIRGISNTSICLDIFTNATCISLEQHELLKKTINAKPKSITFHISLDGDEGGHNYLRRNNMAYQKTIENLRTIIFYGGIVNVETIVHKKNVYSLESLISMLVDFHVKYIYIHPMFSPKSENILDEKELTIEERMECFNIIYKLIKKYMGVITISYIDPYFPIIPYLLHNKIGISPNNNQIISQNPINCMAGLDKMFINNKGEVYPCLLFNKSKRDYCGNIIENSLMDLWKSKGMKFVRKPIYESMLKCSNCSYNRVCFGKIKSCRRAIELLTNDYKNVMPICEELLREKRL